MCVLCVIFWETLQTRQALSSDSVPAGSFLALFVRQSYCFSFSASLDVTKREKGHQEGGKLTVKFLSLGLCYIPLGMLTACREGDMAEAGLSGKASRATAVS